MIVLRAHDPCWARLARGPHPQTTRLGEGTAPPLPPGQGDESGLTRQGSQALGQVVWVPSGDLSAQLDAFLVCRGADQVDGEVSDDGHVFCAMAFAQTRLVF